MSLLTKRVAADQHVMAVSKTDFSRFYCTLKLTQIPDIDMPIVTHV